MPDRSDDVFSMVLVDRQLGARLDRATRRSFGRRFQRMVRAAWRCERTAAPLQVSVRLTDDAGIQELSRVYRDVDGPTDVLAFAAREVPGNAHIPEVLGDIVISLITAERQAKGALLDELLLLAAHGLCHLLGYDHQDADEERVMNERVAGLLREAERRGPTRPA